MLGRRLLCHPGLHFVVLGGALFLLRGALLAPPPLSDEELLFREAARRGLDDTLTVRRRLIQNMRFLAPGSTATEAELLAQARELGFHRSDPVVRRLVIEQMRLLAKAESGPDVFTDAELASYLGEHGERYRVPAYVRLTQVFLSAERRGTALEADARALLARLLAQRIEPAAALALGDPFPLGPTTGLAAASDLERIYGGAFARAVVALPAGTWAGPLESAQGLHLVWVHEARPARPAMLAEVRSQLLLALAEERGEARLAATLARLRQQHAVPEGGP